MFGGRRRSGWANTADPATQIQADLLKYNKPCKGYIASKFISLAGGGGISNLIDFGEKGIKEVQIDEVQSYV